MPCTLADEHDDQHVHSLRHPLLQEHYAAAVAAAVADVTTATTAAIVEVTAAVSRASSVTPRSTSPSPRDGSKSGAAYGNLPTNEDATAHGSDTEARETRERTHDSPWSIFRHADARGSSPDADTQPPRRRARYASPDRPQAPSGPGMPYTALKPPTRNLRNTIQRDPAVPVPPKSILNALYQNGFALGNSGVSTEDIKDALRLHDHPRFTHDPTLQALGPWTDIMQRPPNRLTWVLEDSGGNSGETIFPYLTWDLRQPTTDAPTVFWHGTRGDLAARLAASGGHLLPGPRRETKGRTGTNVGRTYVSVHPSLAAWYAMPPHPPYSLEDDTLAWGPIALWMCEATQPPRGENRHNVVKGEAHGARLIYPRVLSLLIRMDWCAPTEAASRCRALPHAYGMGDCAHALYIAGYDHPDLREAAE
ncbi:MAG: hypothetical protein GY811_25535, partial [Myxococcales bacterium]|nr:hypothetical protein [Myxococcales bacterium]